MTGSRAEAPDVDLLFTGTVFCDVVFAGVPVPRAGGEVFAEAFSITPGGAANRAVAAARLGARTVLLSHLGDDLLGGHLRTLLDGEPNLDVSRIALLPGHQTAVTVSLTGAHERSFITYQEHLPAAEPPAELTSVGATHVGVDTPVPAWAKALRAKGATVVGGVGFDPTEAWASDLFGHLADVDVFVPNDLEAMRYTRTDDAVAAARALGEHVPLAVVTRGAAGVVAFDSSTGELTEAPAVPVAAVDTTGAGDVFVAAFMTTLARDWPLAAKLRFAGLAASLSVMHLGGAASAPTPSALAGFLSTHDPAGDWACIREWLSAHSSIHSKENQ